MKIRWNEMTVSAKVMIIVRIVASIGVMVLAALQLLGVWDKAINLAAPLMGVVMNVRKAQRLRNMLLLIGTFMVLGSYF